jgi:hypothetical protein
MPGHGLSLPQKGNTTFYGKSVKFGVQEVVIENALVIFLGSLTADDFFSDLERVDIADGAIFRRRLQVVQYFPERLSVKLDAYETKWPPSKGVAPSPSGVDPEFMRALRFQAQWKTGMKLRAVDTLSVEKIRDQEEQPDNDFLRRRWTYDLTVQSVEVPLTDHLIVSVFSKENKMLVRLSASL